MTPLRSFPILIALLCFAGLRVFGGMSGSHQEALGAGSPLAHHAALLLACETSPENLTLPQTALPLGLTDFSVTLPDGPRGTFCPLQGGAEVGAGKRVWRAVSRGPPGTV